MRAIMISIFAALLLSAVAQGQSQNKSRNFTDRAQIQHGVNSATVVANSPRPLEQAVKGVAEEYGWTVDFEDPPFSSQRDIADATAPEWRAQHPGAKGVTMVNGGAFQSQFPENPGTAASVTDEENILNKLVSDYNQSGNPGKFTILREGPDRFSIIGTSVNDDTGNPRQVRSVLDTPISLTSATRSGQSTLELILSAVAAQTGTTVNAGLIPVGLLNRSSVAAGGDNVPARTLLQQIVTATGQKLYWELLYDTDGKTYFLSLLPVMRAEYDALGNRRTVLVK